MKRKPPVPTGYLEKLLDLLADNQFQPGGAFVIEERHDDDCDLLNGRGPCTCDAEVEKPRRVQ